MEVQSGVVEGGLSGDSAEGIHNRAIAEPITAVPNARRWFHLTPGKLLVVLLAVEGILLLSERWFPKGWAVLIAVAAVGVFLLVMLLWLAVALLFRRRFQFSIRSLMLLTVAFAVPFSWLGVELRQAKRQKEAVDVFLKGSSNEYIISDMMQNRTLYSNTNGVAPKWLQSMVGEDFFRTVENIRIFHSTIWLTKDKMSRLTELNDLRVLELHDIRIEDGWEYLEQLKSLCKLNMERNNLTDAEVKYLGNMDQLVSLDLSRTLITDAGLKRLVNLTHLEILDLSRTDVTDAGVAELQKALPNCKIEH